MNRKGKMKYLTLACLSVMIIGILYGCGTNNSTAKSMNTEAVSKEETTSKETELPKETEPVGSATQMTSPTEKSTDKSMENDEPTSSMAEIEETQVTEPESQNEIQSTAQEEKSLCGAYELSFESDGGATCEITYTSDEGVLNVSFSGSLGYDAGGTEGTIAAYTDGTDNIWEYYDNSEFESGNYNPSFRLQYDGIDSIIVTSLDGQTFGGMQFPGFEGTYVRTAEYPMP